METSITKYSERGNTIYYTVEFVIDGISGRTEKRWNDFGSLKDVLRKLNKKVYDKAASMKGFSSKPEKRQVQLAGFLSKIIGIASTDAERAEIRAFLQSESGGAGGKWEAIQGKLSAAASTVAAVLEEYTPGSSQQAEADLGQLEKSSICAALSSLIYSLPSQDQEQEHAVPPFDLELDGLAAKAMVKFLKEGSPQWALCHVSSMEHQAATAPAFDVLVFRGTKTAEDKLVDAQFKCKPAPELDTPDVLVHAGMLGAMQDSWSEIAQGLSDHHAVDTPLWITGHSLGGGYAQYAVARLLKEGKEEGTLCDPHQLQACTFGAPPIFSSAKDAGSQKGAHAQEVKGTPLMSEVHEKLQIYVHGVDPIPRSTKKLGYAALGSFHFISKEEEAGGSMAVYEGTTNYEEVGPMLKDSGGIFDVEAGRMDHKKDIYAGKLARALAAAKAGTD